MSGRTWCQIEKRRETLIFALLPSSGAPFIFLMSSLYNFCPIPSFFPFSSLLHIFPIFWPVLDSVFSSSTSRICSAALPSRLTVRLPCHLELPSSHHEPLTFQTSVLDSSFSALTLEIITIGQIMLLKKTTGSNWRRNRNFTGEVGKCRWEKGGERINLSRDNSRQNKRKGRIWSWSQMITSCNC